MHDGNTHEADPEGYLDSLVGQSNWTLMGAKLWWMITARQVTGIWPSKERVQAVLNQRKGVLHEELRIRVARKHLAGELDGGDL